MHEGNNFEGQNEMVNHKYEQVYSRSYTGTSGWITQTWTQRGKTGTTARFFVKRRWEYTQEIRT